MILVELGERTFEGELTTRDLQALNEIAGAHEQHAPSVLDEREPDGYREMALASAGRSSDIMPAFRRSRSKSPTHFIRGAARGSALSAPSDTRASIIWWFDSPTTRWRCCRR